MDSGSGHVQQIENYVNFEGVLGLETEAEMLKKLQDCLEPLRENQIQVDRFTVADMQNLGFMSRQMVKHVRVLTTIPYKEVRDSVLLKANSLRLCPLSHEMISLRHIVEVCRWIKTESGIKALVEVQRNEKLKRRATAKGRTLAEACMIRAMNAQFAEYTDEIKEADRRKSLEPYWIMREEEFSAIRNKYWPASTFHISNIVNEESILDFCRKDQGVKSRLIEYVKGLIGGEKKIYPHRKVEVLRVVLAGMEDGTDVVQASCEGQSSTMNGKKRSDATVLGYGEEPLLKTRKK
ncbi:hypothetical protein AALP_AAs69811U000100 [Arabis alpina]|uniref:Uncharacterized protein n=1 Tax=Arabis alpina TaxID=50452 RepID=A0A087FXC0_ARAAL|nr:hypothetical protein AALP_AAs69811U000100 [Arabis alpina]